MRDEGRPYIQYPCPCKERGWKGETQGRRPGKDRGRGGSDVFIRQGVPRMVSKQQKSEEATVLPWLLWWGPANSFILYFQAPWLWKNTFLLFQASQFMVIYHSSLEKRICSWTNSYCNSSTTSCSTNIAIITITSITTTPFLATPPRAPKLTPVIAVVQRKFGKPPQGNNFLVLSWPIGLSVRSKL